MVTATHKPKNVLDVDRTIGTTIGNLRRAKGMSQKELAAAVGVTFQQVQKYEAGLNRMGASRVAAVAQGLGVSVADLFGDAHAGMLQDPRARELLELFDGIKDEAGRSKALARVRTVARACEHAGA